MVSVAAWESFFTFTVIEYYTIMLMISQLVMNLMHLKE